MASLAVLGAAVWVAVMSAAARAAAGEGEAVFAWGLNTAGQLGTLHKDRLLETPTRVAMLEGRSVAQVAASGDDVGRFGGHMLVMTEDGALFAAGDNSYGQLGVAGSTADDISEAASIWEWEHRSDRDHLLPVLRFCTNSTEALIDIAAGESHSLALTATNEVFAWGSNLQGQLGLPDTVATIVTPIRLSLQLQRGEAVVGVAAGGKASFFWTSLGRVLAYGAVVNTTNPQAPVAPKSMVEEAQVRLRRERIRKIVVGQGFALVISNGGALYWAGRKSTAAASWLRSDTSGDDLALIKLEFGPSLLSKTEVEPVRVVDACAGADFSFAVSDKGELYELNWVSPGLNTTGPFLCKLFSWGANEYGELGRKSTPADDYVTCDGVNGGPQPVTAVFDGPIIDITVASRRSFILSATGGLFACGSNDGGQLGLIAAAAPVRSPVLVVAPPSAVTFRSIVAGGYGLSYQAHSGVVTTAGDAYIWGWNAFGQLGLGAGDFSLFYTQPFPHYMRAFSSTGVGALSLGQFSSVALTLSNANTNGGRGGDLLTWGTNEHGVLGKGDFVPSTVEYPMRIPTDRDSGSAAGTSSASSGGSGGANGYTSNVASGFGGGLAKGAEVVMGGAHAILRDTKGRVYSWGLNTYGQLGLGDHRDRSSPELVEALSDVDIIAIAAGQFTSFAITRDGRLFAWGFNRDGELGVEDCVDRAYPQEVIIADTGSRVQGVAAGGYHTLAWLVDGSLFAFGSNSYGQLGLERSKTNTSATADSDEESERVAWPQQVPLGKGVRVKTAAAGTWHSLVVDMDGELYAFGRCDSAQLGFSCRPSSENIENGRYVHTPTVVEALAGKFVSQVANISILQDSVAAGPAHSLAVVAP